MYRLAHRWSAHLHCLPACHLSMCPLWSLVLHHLWASVQCCNCVKSSWMCAQYVTPLCGTVFLGFAPFPQAPKLSNAECYVCVLASARSSEASMNGYGFSFEVPKWKLTPALRIELHLRQLMYYESYKLTRGSALTEGTTYFGQQLSGTQELILCYMNIRGVIYTVSLERGCWDIIKYWLEKIKAWSCTSFIFGYMQRGRGLTNKSHNCGCYKSLWKWQGGPKCFECILVGHFRCCTLCPRMVLFCLQIITVSPSCHREDSGFTTVPRVMMCEVMYPVRPVGIHITRRHVSPPPESNAVTWSMLLVLVQCGIRKGAWLQTYVKSAWSVLQTQYSPASAFYYCTYSVRVSGT